MLQYYEKSFEITGSATRRTAKDVFTIGYSFILSIWSIYCYLVMTILLGLTFAVVTSGNYIPHVIFGFLAYICCLCSSYNYYNLSKAKDDLSNLGTTYKNKPDSRPCIDSSGNTIE